MRKESQPLYTVSMSVFYTILKWAVNLYSNYADDFISFSQTYTEDWADNMQKAIDFAQAMPNVGQRSGNTKSVGNDLDLSSKAGVLVWKKLRRYIIKSFDPANIEAALQQAGSEHYDKAARLNFGEISSLMTAGQSFVKQNIDVLIAGGMPDTLPTDFEAAKSKFDKQHAAYGTAKGEASTATSDKIAANNKLYAQIMNMFGDAQIIFAGQRNIAKQFSFQAVKRIITKDAPSGIHFTVKDSTNKKPVILASIITSNSPDAKPVNKRGALELKLSKATYTYTVTAPGYTPVSGIITIDSSGMSRLSITLSKAEDVAVAS